MEQPSHLRRLAKWAIPSGAALVAGITTLPLITAGTTSPAVHGEHEDIPTVEAPGELVVMTLNLAHGRSDGFHQALQSTKAITGHLEDIGEVIRRVNPQVVAFQEADGPSMWSGKFDHVRFLATQGGFHHWIRGDHVKGLGIRYGTGLISKLPSHEPISVTFAPSPPTLSKGFVRATLRFTPERAQPVNIDVVSIHLDFSRASVRRAQINSLIEALKDRKNPRIVMGDFNTNWTSEPILAQLCEALDLHAWRPKAKTAGTFPFSGKRIDWILVSPQFEFQSREVLTDTLSDHQAVLAYLRWTPSPRGDTP